MEIWVRVYIFINWHEHNWVVGLCFHEKLCFPGEIHHGSKILKRRKQIGLLLHAFFSKSHCLPSPPFFAQWSPSCQKFPPATATRQSWAGVWSERKWGVLWTSLVTHSSWLSAPCRPQINTYYVNPWSKELLLQHGLHSLDFKGEAITFKEIC